MLRPILSYSSLILPYFCCPPPHIINSLLTQFKFPFADYNHSLVHRLSKSLSLFWFILPCKATNLDEIQLCLLHVYPGAAENKQKNTHNRTDWCHFKFMTPHCKWPLILPGNLFCCPFVFFLMVIGFYF